MLFAVVHYLCYFFSCHHKSYFWHKNNDGKFDEKIRDPPNAYGQSSSDTLKYIQIRPV